MPSRSLTDSEINQIVAHMDSKRDIALFQIGIRTGYRISEILSLCVSDVYTNGIVNDSVTVKRANMKGKSVSRTVPLHDKAKAAISNYTQSAALGANDKLFPISRVHAWRILKQATNALQLKGKVSTHSMRKTFAMRVYSNSGKDLKATQLALGHKNISSTGMYLSVDTETIDNLILMS